MKQNIQMPKLSPSMSEGVLAAWLKQVREEVQEGEVLFEVEIDKVVCQIESVGSGVLEAVYYEEGDRVPVGETVALVG